MVAKCCWKESKAELPPPVIVERTKNPPNSVDGSTKEKCRISLDSSFSNDSVASSSGARLSQSFEVDCDRKLDSENEIIDLTKSGRTGKGKLNSRARSTSSTGLIETHFLLFFVT
jgi:hypothetical protein